jgi:hypothetical protein
LSVFKEQSILYLFLLLGISETFLCSVSALLVKIALVLGALQLLMLFVETLKYLEPKLFLLIIFYNDGFLIVKILIYATFFIRRDRLQFELLIVSLSKLQINKICVVHELFGD